MDTTRKKPRPEWSKAGKNSISIKKTTIKFEPLFTTETQAPHLESSLADLQQKTLYLPRSALGESFEEIGRGKHVIDFRSLVTLVHHIKLNS